jgi:hypothetical protein
MAIECLHVYLLAGLGHHLSEIFPGLFTRKDSDKKAPTQNVYIIKSVSLLSNPPGVQLFKTGGLSERTK